MRVAVWPPVGRDGSALLLLLLLLNLLRDA